ncbi:MAG: transporter substrate-binding domain-containing protein [Gammaproteobacteria bacterium]|nr:transporter substrate-binding domain-containing protein [Gammaproteobacteria bacterium]
MRFTRLKLVLLALICIVFDAALAIDEKHIAIVATEYPPYYGSELEGNGFITEIVIAAFVRSGYVATVKFLPWQRAFDGAKAGKYPVLYTMWYRKEREQWFEYSDALPANEIGFFKRLEDDITFSKFRDLKPYTIGVVRGYVNPPGFDEAGLSTEVVNTDALNLNKLLRGRIDLVLIDKLVAQHILDTDHPLNKHQVHWMRPPVKVETQHLVVSKQNPDSQTILGDFNRGLAEITADGTMQKILQKHGF